MGYLGNQITTVFPTSISVDTATISSDVNISDKIVHDGDTNTAIRFPSADTISFETGGSQRAQVDSSGNFMVGKTSVGSSSVGFEARANGFNAFTRDGGQPLEIRRLNSDGVLIDLRKDGTTVGILGSSNTDQLVVGTPDGSEVGFRFDGDLQHILPATTTGAKKDNLVDFGSSSARFDDIFATNGTIQTSDRNEKQDIEELSDAEKRVAVVAKGLMRKFRWKDKVAEKGDDARTHFGIIAQDLQDAFTAESLDASKYAMFCSDTWTNEDGSEQTRLGVRYSELLAFIISAL